MSGDRWKENAKQHEAMSADVSTLKSDVSTLKSDVLTLQSDVVKIKEVMSEILRKVTVLQHTLTAIAGSVGFSLVLFLGSWAWRFLSGQ